MNMSMIIFMKLYIYIYICVCVCVFHIIQVRKCFIFLKGRLKYIDLSSIDNEIWCQSLLANWYRVNYYWKYAQNHRTSCYVCVCVCEISPDTLNAGNIVWEEITTNIWLQNEVPWLYGKDTIRNFRICAPNEIFLTFKLNHVWWSGRSTQPVWF